MQERKQSEKATKRIMELVNQGKQSYDAIADTVNKEGFRTVLGKPFSNGTVSHVAIEQGVRKYTREGSPRKQYSKPKITRRGHVPVGNGRWDLLRHIEQCDDLDAATKKALLELVFREINK